MELLMNGLLLAATLFAGGYCWILSGRVRELKSLDKGLGASIVTLTRQIEMARTTLEEARGAAKESRQEMSALVARAETASGQLRMLLAAVREPEPSAHDRRPRTSQARSRAPNARRSRPSAMPRRRRRRPAPTHPDPARRACPLRPRLGSHASPRSSPTSPSRACCRRSPWRCASARRRHPAARTSCSRP